MPRLHVPKKLPVVPLYYFDDQPIETTPGGQYPGPTPVFTSAGDSAVVDTVRTIIQRRGKTCYFKVVEDIPSGIHYEHDELMHILSGIAEVLPTFAYSAIRYDVSRIRHILFDLWNSCSDYTGIDARFTIQVGMAIQRYHEARDNYEKAKNTGRTLMTVALATGDPYDLATEQNNYAFDCALNRDYEEALDYYNRANAIFGKHPASYDYFNTSCNIVLTRKMMGDPGWHEAAIVIAAHFTDHVSESGSLERKKAVVQAYLAEAAGDVAAAAVFARRAEELSHTLDLRYYPEDRRYRIRMEGKAHHHG